MQLTELQLEIMRLWASKELSFGCVIKRKWDDPRIYVWQSAGYWFDLYQEHSIPPIKECCRIWYIDWYYDDENNYTDEYEILGHPITRWRLCYLRQTDKSEDTVVNWVKQKMEKWINLCWNFENNPELYNQNILTRNEDVLNLVRDFLLSIQ